MSAIASIGPGSMTERTALLEAENKRLKKIEKEAEQLRQDKANAYAALQQGRRGDALAILRPKTVTAPIAATGDMA
jgi:hypothetical protein